MKAIQDVVPPQVAATKKELLSAHIREVLTESAQLFTVLLVLLGIDALLAPIWPNEKTRHGLLDLVVLAGWLALMFKLKLFQIFRKSVVGRAVHAVRFVLLFAICLLFNTLVDSWYPNSTGRSSLGLDIIRSLIVAGVLTLLRVGKKRAEEPFA